METAMKPTLTIYIPQAKQAKNLLERLEKLANQQDRSVNYLAVQALSDYVERAEAE